MEEKKRITLVVPGKLVAAMKQLAQEHQRSFVGEIVWALQQYIQAQQKGKQ